MMSSVTDMVSTVLNFTYIWCVLALTTLMAPSLWRPVLIAEVETVYYLNFNLNGVLGDSEDCPSLGDSGPRVTVYGI